MNGIQLMVQEMLSLGKESKLQAPIEKISTCTCCGISAHTPREKDRIFYVRKVNSTRPNGRVGRRAGTVLQPCKECTNSLKKGKLCKKKY